MPFSLFLFVTLIFQCHKHVIKVYQIIKKVMFKQFSCKRKPNKINPKIRLQAQIENKIIFMSSREKQEYSS